jgi:hypothetical protein
MLDIVSQDSALSSRGIVAALVGVSHLNFGSAGRNTLSPNRQSEVPLQFLSAIEAAAHGRQMRLWKRVDYDPEVAS